MGDVCTYSRMICRGAEVAIELFKRGIDWDRELCGHRVMGERSEGRINQLLGDGAVDGRRKGRDRR